MKKTAYKSYFGTHPDDSGFCNILLNNIAIQKRITHSNDAEHLRTLLMYQTTYELYFRTEGHQNQTDWSQTCS